MRIVFLCTGNSARSQMAEGWARCLAPQWDLHSAGTMPTSQVNPYAVKVMAEKGIDLSAHRPKTLDSVPKPLDRIVAVCAHAADNCPVVPGVETERWDLPDPAAFHGTEDKALEVFRNSRDEIERRVRDLVSRLE